MKGKIRRKCQGHADCIFLAHIIKKKRLCNLSERVSVHSPNKKQHGPWHVFQDGHDLVKTLLGHFVHVLEILLTEGAWQANGGPSDWSLY